MRAIRPRHLPLLGLLVAFLLTPGPALAARTLTASFGGADTPAGSFDGACGVALDGEGDIYVADYYHHVVDIFNASHQYLTHVVTAPTNGPCGLAVDGAGRLYVDTYHESLTRYTPSSYPPRAGTGYGGETVLDTAHPTGVALDPASGDLFVDERTAVQIFDGTGAPLRRIELAPGADAYGVAVSDSPSSEGDVYVADAASGEVEVYGPTGSLVGRIDGAGDPRGGFASLADAALAIEPRSGDLLVAEDTQPGFESPAAAVEEFDPTGTYVGELGHPVVDAVPSGLVATPTGGLWVGSGNGPGASVLEFGLAGSEPLFKSFGVPSEETPLAPAPSRRLAAAASSPSSSEMLGVSSNAGLLRVLAPMPGLLRIDGRDLSVIHRRIGAEEVSLRPRLDRRGLHALAESPGGELRVPVRLRFEPVGGGATLLARTQVTFSRPSEEGKR